MVDVPLAGVKLLGLLVTDGGDTTSTKTFHDALEAAQLADAVMYAILVMPILGHATWHAYRDLVVRETGSSG